MIPKCVLIKPLLWRTGMASHSTLTLNSVCGCTSQLVSTFADYLIAHRAIGLVEEYHHHWHLAMPSMSLIHSFHSLPPASSNTVMHLMALNDSIELAFLYTSFFLYKNKNKCFNIYRKKPIPVTMNGNNVTLINFRLSTLFFKRLHRYLLNGDWLEFTPFIPNQFCTELCLLCHLFLQLTCTLAFMNEMSISQKWVADCHQG